VLGSSAASLVGTGFFVVWLPLDGCGYRFVRARGGHAHGGDIQDGSGPNFARSSLFPGHIC